MFNNKEYIFNLFVFVIEILFIYPCCWIWLFVLLCVCFVHSKVSRPDNLALHVFEVDEDVDKDEVREITQTHGVNWTRFILITPDVLMTLCQITVNRTRSNVMTWHCLSCLTLPRILLSPKATPHIELSSSSSHSGLSHVSSFSADVCWGVSSWGSGMLCIYLCSLCSE